MTVKATVTPTSVTLQPIQPRTFRVHSSVPGPNTFSFNPGDGRGWSKVPKYGDYTRAFRYYWSQVGTYTYQDGVTNEYYGPGYAALGTARIRYYLVVTVYLWSDVLFIEW